ncbi:branched-chain amino acid ABC transporter permease [Streptomyces pluripotens]|uniref:Branched-chain amino acid ABC transporter permease n=1 Tax=Streptomyces pluripotens TaxID=1355015 RepID=A0A221NSH6_9ACTN|nr:MULTISPECIES: branched-chain amino acid ABC transporter permease [Streptomyces]ARP68601.1 branched-chain amino acid ABC transporter permease [Streptomyces pluripotens]ASN22862.1 branched-chain amino acid ABC transporter permease [Streptomyces pluripotens]KIE23320.1 ABC transporter permease [Streptomyces sp. MUSC 125]MCH0558260.1 branched-chain amino acid ABC transporter permease [Streptomyces sp. MUM 16J]
MSTVVLLTLTGLGLGALYFLVASGLSLIFGLMDVLNFAHGALMSIGAYATWWAASGRLPGAGPGGAGFALAVVFGTAVGTMAAVLLELAVIRPLYARPRDQILATVGVGLAVPALLSAIWGADARPFPGPRALSGVFDLLGAEVPFNRLVLIAAALVVFAALRAFLSRTRYGLVVRAGVEDRAMVTALGIDVRRAFTLVFALGGAAAALGGAIGGLYFGSVDPRQGTSLLIFAFVVVVTGGMGSLTGAALAAAAVGLVQQFANYYTTTGLGDLAVVVLLAALLLVRPRGLTGRPT